MNAPLCDVCNKPMRRAGEGHRDNSDHRECVIVYDCVKHGDCIKIVKLDCTKCSRKKK